MSIVEDTQGQDTEGYDETGVGIEILGDNPEGIDPFAEPQVAPDDTAAVAGTGEGSQVPVKGTQKARTAKAGVKAGSNAKASIPAVTEPSKTKRGQAKSKTEGKKSDWQESPEAKAIREKLEKDKSDREAEAKRKKAEKALALQKKEEEDALIYEEAYTVTELTPEQKARRDELEREIEEYTAATVANGNKALFTIQKVLDEGLHHDYQSARHYLEARWNISKTHANRQLVYGQVAGTLIAARGKITEETGEQEKDVYKFENYGESLARPLATLGSKQKMNEAWAKVVKDCKKRSKIESEAQGKEVIVRPTAKMVKVVVDEMKGLGKTAVGLDAEIESRDKAQGKVSKSAWRQELTQIAYVDYKGRRYQATYFPDGTWLSEVWELLIGNAGEVVVGQRINSRAASSQETAFAFWDSEKAAFDKADTEEFEAGAGMPTPEYFHPETGEDIPAPNQTLPDGQVTASSVAPEDDAEAEWSE